MESSHSCSYCGLPLTIAVTEQQERYCCFGCRIAASIAGERTPSGESGATQLRLGLAVFFAMNVMVFTMFLWSQPEQVNDPAALALYNVARYLCLLFSLPVVLLLGPALIQDAIENLRTGRFAANLLLIVGVVASFLYSAWSVIFGQGHVYFEVGVMVLVLVTLGRWLEAEGKLRTTRSLRELQNLLPETVRLVTPAGVELVPLLQVKIGNQIRILPGERIAIDGKILRGRATVDEQMVTGESIPVEKDPGQTVYSGTFNLDGELVVVATANGQAGTLQRLLDTVTQAASQRNTYQRLADRIAAWLLPLVAVVAVLTFVVQLWLGWSNSGLEMIERPLLSSLAVVVIACPCALGLATPMALWAALGKAANQQVLFRQGDALSQLAAARLVCFDKTGTLTTGQLTTLGVWIAPGANRQTIEHVAAALTDRSNHPVAVAVGQSLQADPGLIDLVDVWESPGRGMKAWSPALRGEILLGSWRWLIENDCDTSHWRRSAECRDWEQHVLSFLAIEGRLVATFAIDESLRPEARETVESLRQLGVSVRLLTGDRQSRTAHIASQLGIDFEAELLPQAKFRRIGELMKTQGPVVMVGDGLNDAPALAAADVGIALGCGADLSREAAAVCILSNRLDRVPWAIQLAREANHTLRWNLLWAFGYNLAAVPLAALGLVNPIIAAIAMAVSSLLVVANSLKLAATPTVDSASSMAAEVSSSNPQSADHHPTLSHD